MTTEDKNTWGHFGPGYPKAEMDAAIEALEQAQKVFAQFPSSHKRAKNCEQATFKALLQIGDADFWAVNVADEYYFGTAVQASNEGVA